MALVVDGVGTLEVAKAAVLRLERGLEVGAVVDRVRPGVAGEHGEVAREALLQVDGESVVPGSGVGVLGIDAVEGHRRATHGITRGLGEGLLDSKAAGEEHAIGSARATAPCSSADASRKRRVRTGLPEEVEECWRGNQANWIS